MRLITITSASATQQPGVLIIEAKVDMGQGRNEVIPVTYDPDHLTPLTAEIREWMNANGGLYIRPLETEAPQE